LGCDIAPLRCYTVYNKKLNIKRAIKMDHRDFAIELVEEMDYSAKDMLVACLKYMSQDDVKDMLEANEYPMSCEEEFV
tara:strand:- start:104 stop:337 length:234 start_codon:yes stop_codon:yes gene_type:complete